METVKSEIRLLAPVEKVWTYFSEPHHVQKWFFAIKDWRCARALNELREGGNFSYRMENKDGSHGYDFVGTIDSVIPMEKILSTLDDGRN
nr:SRPBCC domain-containing protein [Chryseobacterium sp.]